MEKYEPLEIKVFVFENEDIIITSGPYDGEWSGDH